jgi:hypothetical protein
MPGHEIAPKQKLFKKPGFGRKQKRAMLARFMLIAVITITMIVTGGFGTFPPNELTANSASLFSQNFPVEMVRLVNQVLEQTDAQPLEVVEHPQSPDSGSEIAKIFENLVKSIFATLPTTPTEAAAAINADEAFRTSVANAVPTIEAGWTQTAEVVAAFTGAPLPVDAQAALALPITGNTPTAETIQPSSTPALLPTKPVVYIPPSPTKTKKAKPVDIPTIGPTNTGTPTLTATPTTVPAGHLITSVSLNGGGNSVTVTGGSSVTMDYTYQVWGDSSTCPGCNYQIVWGLDNAWQWCSGWISPAPGDYPGQSGTSTTSGSTVTITAPSAQGTYTIYSFAGQYPDCSSAIPAYSAVGGTPIGQITVSCVAGLTNLGWPINASDAIAINYTGSSWWSTTPGGMGSPDACVLTVINDSAANLPFTIQLPDGTCRPTYTVPASGGWVSVSGNNLIGECPLNTYIP